jgi:hypothetical protein
VAFVLSWMLKEVPLRATTHTAAELAADEVLAPEAVPAPGGRDGSSRATPSPVD